MPRFRVKFIKTLPDSTGHDHQICQRTISLDADDRQAALLAAQHRFCQLENVSRWVDHADSVHIEAAEGAAD